MLKDYFKLAVSNVLHRKLRSWLTVIGILIGVAAIVSLISLGQGMKKGLDEQFEKLGTDSVTVMPKLAGSFSISADPLSEKDLDIIKKTAGVKEVMAYAYRIAGVEYLNKKNYFFVISMQTDKSAHLFYDMTGGIIEGRELREGDRYKVIIGYRLAYTDEYFQKPIKVGDKIKIDEKEFSVIGVMAKIGNKQDDTQIYINLDTHRDLYKDGDILSGIIFTVSNPDKVEEIAETVKKKLRTYRNLKEGEENFDVQTTEQLKETYGNILDIVSWVLIGIAAISLLVGGVGIMNTMYTSILERTNEIGIMKSVGAKNSDILLIFLFESGLLGLVGGMMGVLIGIGLSKSVEFIAVNFAGFDMLKAYLGFELIIGALLFSFVIGMISGTLPAWRASKLKPVDALKQ